MAQLIGRKAIAEHLGTTCGQISRLIKKKLPVRFEGRQMYAQSEQLDVWESKQDVLKCRVLQEGEVVGVKFFGLGEFEKRFGISRKSAAELFQAAREELKPPEVL